MSQSVRCGITAALCTQVLTAMILEVVTARATVAVVPLTAAAPAIDPHHRQLIYDQFFILR